MSETNSIDIIDYIVNTEDSKISIREIFNMVKYGDIVTDPEYQRNYIYSEEKASRVIESILLGIPLPAIYTSETQNETYEVIDGVQRITSIVKFIDNEYKLKGLTILTALNGKTFKELPSKIKNAFKLKTIRRINFKKSCSEDVKFEVFARLNQGAATLNEQELRNCLYRGYFNNRIKEMAQHYKIIELTSFFKSEEVNRLAREEFILKILTIMNFERISKRTPNASKVSLNKMMYSFRDTKQVVDEMIKEFFNTALCIYQIIGEDALYREFTSDEKRHNDPMIYGMFLAFRNYKINNLIAEADFIRADVDSALDKAYLKKITKPEIIAEMVLEKLDEHAVISNERTFPYELKVALYSKDNTCAICGQSILSIKDAHVDHIIPWSKGGTTTIDNAQLTHIHCNCSKGNRTYEEEFETPKKKKKGIFNFGK